MNRNKLWIRFSSAILVFLMIFNLLQVNTSAAASDTILNKIKEIVRENYIENVPERVYEAKTIDSFIDQLGDPYTRYFTEKEYSSFKDNIEMKFVGIGVHIEMVPEGVLVISLISGAPAEDAGILQGDIIISADGKSLAGLSSEEAVNYIMGEEGTYVKLKIKRNQSIFDLSVVRKEIKTDTVTGSVLKDHIGYIQLESFGNETTTEFKEVLKNLESKNVDSYIVDIRNNPGGYMHTALDIAGYFIGDNTAMIVQDKKYNTESLKGNKHDYVIDKPVVFLINEYSASASEILAAAVKDYGKAFFIGKTTYGKGVAQSIYEFPDGSALKTTTLRFLSPFGKVINKIGVSPDLKMDGEQVRLAAELLLGSSKNLKENGRYLVIKLNSRDYKINLNDVTNDEYWDALEYILDESSQVSNLIAANASETIPQIKILSPDLKYSTGERVTLKINTPNYGGRVQYRVMLWDDVSKKYHDLWDSKDKYYSGWKPYGNETFTLGFKAEKPGNYRLKIFVKRAGVENSKTALMGMNCDSYIEEIPFSVN